jgi:hypothetical protein
MILRSFDRRWSCILDPSTVTSFPSFLSFFPQLSPDRRRGAQHVQICALDVEFRSALDQKWKNDHIIIHLAQLKPAQDFRIDCVVWFFYVNLFKTVAWWWCLYQLVCFNYELIDYDLIKFIQVCVELFDSIWLIYFHLMWLAYALSIEASSKGSLTLTLTPTVDCLR